MSRRIKSVSYIRGLSAALIFICHILFISGAFEVSMWFNTGVPLFFIISAYLLSLKSKISIGNFYSKRFKSIFPSYWIYLAVIITCLFIIGQGPDIKSMVYYSLGASGMTNDVNILGLGHLWFISVLLICYLLTPLLSCIVDTETKLQYKCLLLATIIAIMTVASFTIGFPAYSIHFASYIFVYSFYRFNRGIVSRRQMTIWILIAVFISVVRLIEDPIFMSKEYIVYYYYDSLFQPIARFCVAMALFVIFVYNSEKIENWAIRSPHKDKVISGFSDISYEVYLTHQFILLAFWEFIPFFHTRSGIIVWCIMSFIATIVNALILSKVKEYLTNKIFNKRIIW